MPYRQVWGVQEVTREEVDVVTERYPTGLDLEDPVNKTDMVPALPLAADATKTEVGKGY